MWGAEKTAKTCSAQGTFDWTPLQAAAAAAAALQRTGEHAYTAGCGYV